MGRLSAAENKDVTQLITFCQETLVKDPFHHQMLLRLQISAAACFIWQLKRVMTSVMRKAN